MARDDDSGAPAIAHHFSHDPTAPRAAREALASIVGTGEFADTVSLAASELVANVVLHTDNGGRLEAWGDDPLRIEVFDTSSILPQPCSPSAGGGRGLSIVEAVSADWGVELTPDGKVIWAEFERPPD